MRAMILPALLLLAGCGDQSVDKAQPGVASTESLTNRIEDGPGAEAVANEAAPAPAAADQSAWVGRWTGPEGLFLTIAEGKAPGTFDLVVKGDLDSQGDPFVGRAEGDAIIFTRAGEEQRLRKASGDETGLKYLAGKSDCLMVKSGEGWCRD